MSATAAGAEVRVEVEPRWPFRLPRMLGMDGLARTRNGVLHRLVHEDGHPVLVRAAALASGNVLLGANARHAHHGHNAIARMRRALGLDRDLKPFYERFKDDPLIGAPLRADPTLRPNGRPDPFEALTFAVTEQLIEYERAAAIQRRLIRAFGRHDPHSGMRDSPEAAALAHAAPARLESFDLSAGRSVALRRVAREVVAGRVRLEAGPDADPATQEAEWRRLRTIPGVGSWTVEMLAVVGQGRMDQIPAGDLGFIKLVGRIESGGDPYARATEDQVRAFFAPYAPWQALAGVYAFRAHGHRKAAV